MTAPAQPPVNEVVYSISFDRREALTPPRLGMSLASLIAEYPKAETQPPYDMQLELPLEKQPTAISAPKIDFLGAHQVNMRYWLISPDEIEVVQIQPNYMATNWRRRSAEQVYPGYGSLRERFVGIYGRVDQALEAQGDTTLEPRQVELTYVNILNPDLVWHGHDEMHKVVAATFADNVGYEQFSLAYTRALQWSTGGFAGRLYVSAQSAVDITRQHPVINLTLTARSSPIRPRTLGAALEFIDVAHSAVTQAFSRITTPQARMGWGLA